MQQERGLEFKVGLLIVISTIILLGFVFILGNYSLRSGFHLYVDYDYVGALQAGAPIKVSGIKVGKVSDIEFVGGKLDPKLNKRVQVRVTAWIEDRAHDSIRSDAEFFINTAGVLGEQYLEIVPGHDWDKPPMAADQVVHGLPWVHDPPRTDLVVARLYEVLDGVSSVLHDDRDAIKHLLTNSANAVAEINKILVDRREQIGELIGGAADLAKEAKTTLTKVNAGLGDGPRAVREQILDRVAIVVEHRAHAVEHLVQLRDDEIGARRIVHPRPAVKHRAAGDRRIVEVVARYDLEILLAEHAGGVDEELGVGPNAVADALFDPHLDAHLHALLQFRIFFAAPQLDTLDLADLDARHLHRCARLQRADVVVVDVDREARVQREVAEDEDEPEQDHRRHDDQDADLEFEAAFAHAAMVALDEILRDHGPILVRMAGGDHRVHLAGNRRHEQQRDVRLIDFGLHEARVLARHRELPRDLLVIAGGHALGAPADRRARVEVIEQRDDLGRRDADRLAQAERVADRGREAHEERVADQLERCRGVDPLAQIDELAGHRREQRRDARTLRTGDQHEPGRLARVLRAHEHRRVHVRDVGARRAAARAFGRGRRVIDNERARREPGGGEHGIDRRVIRDDDVHARRAARGLRGIGECRRAVCFEGLRALERAVPDLDLLALRDQRASEIRTEQAGSKDGDHDARSLAR